MRFSSLREHLGYEEFRGHITAGHWKLEKFGSFHSFLEDWAVFAQSVAMSKQTPYSFTAKI